MANDQTQQDQQITPEVARTFLADYGHGPETLKTMADPDVLKLHGTVSAAQKKMLEAEVSKATAKDWPTTWRETYVTRVKANAEKAGDKSFDGEKLLGRLQRYASPEAAFDSLIGVQNKISAGELRPAGAFPDKGTPEQQTAWRKERGIPEKPEDYTLTLPQGVALGEEDRPTAENFQKVAHALHYSPEQVSGAVNWYLNTIQQQAADRHEADIGIRNEVEDALRTEWGADFRRNKAMIEAFLDTGGPEIKEAFLNARTADGTPLASDVGVLRFMVDRAREVIDSATVVPGDAANMGKAVEDEIRQFQEWMRAPRGSVEYQRYWGDQKVQERYRQLVGSREKLSQRAKTAA